MNLLCPNCQKMLTVPEQYAGQLMKCPLCAGTFTVPALPPAAPPTPEPPPAPPPAPPAPAPSTANQDIYNFHQEPAAPPPPAPPPTSTTTTPKTPSTPAGAPAPSPPPSVGYTKTHTLWLSPRVLQWVPPATVVLIFFLQFFSWVGVYPGNVPSAAQGAWSAAFGVLDPDSQLDTDLNQVKFGEKFDYPVFENKPRSADTSPVVVSSWGASVFAVFYVLLFILLALPLTVAVVVLPFLKLKLPPAVDRLMPYRWGLVAVLNLVVFLFLFAQMLVGFSIENAVATQADLKVKAASADTAKTTEIKKRDEVDRGRFVEAVKRTFWLRLVFWLHVLAVIAASLMYWFTQRGESRPLPKLEMVY